MKYVKDIKKWRKVYIKLLRNSLLPIYCSRVHTRRFKLIIKILNIITSFNIPSINILIVTKKIEKKIKKDNE